MHPGHVTPHRHSNDGVGGHLMNLSSCPISPKHKSRSTEKVRNRNLPTKTDQRS